jgi:hypothetical protein
MIPYTKEAPQQIATEEELRARIPGWGADLDRRDRPAVPREQSLTTGAHWDFPDRQPEKGRRERSVEHRFLPPVFGTTVPLKGLSGGIRRLAYARYSEGRAAHWLLLILGDRVDAVESHVASLATRRPDDPITQSGVVSEFSHDGLRSRFGRAGCRAVAHGRWARVRAREGGRPGEPLTASGRSASVRLTSSIRARVTHPCDAPAPV